MIIDKAAIIRGSEEKAFDVALREMRDYYSQETAMQFLETYRRNSLSFIMRRIYDIIKEAYYGTGFIKNLLSTTIICPLDYGKIIEVTDDIIRSAKENLAPKDQILKYEEIKKIAQTKLNAIKGTAAVALSVRNYDLDDIFRLYFDVFYEIEKDGDKKEFKEFIEELRYIKEPYIFFSIAPLVLSKYPEYSANTIMEKTRFFYTPYNKTMDANTLDLTLKTVTALNYLSQDEYVIKALDNCGNVNLKFLWKKIMTEKIEDYDKKRTISTCPSNTPVYRSEGNPIEYINRLISESADFDINHGRYELEKYISLEHKKVILEHVLECNTLFDDKILTEEAMDHYLDEIAVTDEEMAMLEWEDDGEPNEVIKSHIMTRKMKEKENGDKGNTSEKDKKKEDSMEEDDLEDASDSPSEISEENKNARQNIIKEVDSALEEIAERAHYSKKGKDEFLNGISNSICLGSFKKENFKEVLKCLKDLTKEKDDFKVSEDNYFTIFLSVCKNSDYFIEADDDFGPIEMSEYSLLYEASNDTTTSDEESVQKPKEDLATKIQNRALDKDAERQKKKALRDEKRTKLRNAGKASTSGIRGEYNSGKSFIQKMDKADENRRKKFMLKPGYRHKIFRNFKHALMYGTVAKLNIFWTPYLMVLRHFSKEKDRRIRNELIRELDTEIKICEEKISDANSNGDQQEKYKLMRIKDKLVAEKQRVEVNSKYI